MLNCLLWNLLLTAALAVVLAALCRLSALRRRPALRHSLWLLLLVKLVTPPLIVVPLLPALSPPDASHAVMLTTIPPSAPSEYRESTVDRQPLQDNSASADATFVAADRDRGELAAPKPHDPTRSLLLAGFLAVSLIGTCVFWTVHGVHAARLYRWLERAGSENRVLAESCADVAASLGVCGLVRSCVVDTRTTPLLWGWHRPMVVVPRELIDDLSPQQLRSIVAHELAHFLRHDHWANLFVFVVKGLLWWNPVVWWADRELRAAQELCCDAIAIDRCQANRRSYAVTLLKALDFIQIEPVAPRALAAGMGSRVSILRRFEMIGETRLSYKLSRWTTLILLALAIPLVCIPVRGQEKAPAASPACDPDDAKTLVDAAVKAGRQKTAKAKPAKAKEDKPSTEMVLGERPRGNCSISGTVVSVETGKPVDHVRMYLHYSVTHGSLFVNTASDGTFTFKDIPKGPFSLQVSLSPGYQDAPYNPENKPGTYPAFSLKDGEHRTGILLKVKRAFRISGKILDENGSIPENIGTLTVLAWSKRDGGKHYENARAMVNRTDGSYAIDGLNGKPVYVMAINWQAAREGRAHPPIYYPSEFSRSDAKPIAFDKQQSVDNVDITLRREGGVVLEGTVRDESGNPVPDAFVVVNHRDMLFDFATAYTDQQGHYQIQGLGDGEFTVHVDAVHRGFVRTRTPLNLDKTIKNARRDFALVKGTLISGQFVDEKGNEWQIGQSYGDAHIADVEPDTLHGFSLTDFRNKHRPHHVAMGSAGSFALGEGDYNDGEMLFPTKSTFVIQGMMPGKTIFGFSPNKEHQRVLKILYDGRDILKSGIQTKPDQEIKDVKIVIGAE